MKGMCTIQVWIGCPVRRCVECEAGDGRYMCEGVCYECWGRLMEGTCVKV